MTAWPDNPSGHGAAFPRYRFQWTAPIAVSPHDPKTVYHGGNVLFRTQDGGQTWAAISGDLTRDDKTKQRWSGGPITGDNTGAEFYCTIFAIAESPREAGLIWAGSDDGLVHVTRDGGKTWTNVTANVPGLPEWGTVSLIEPSPFDAGGGLPGRGQPPHGRHAAVPVEDGRLRQDLEEPRRRPRAGRLPPRGARGPEDEGAAVRRGPSAASSSHPTTAPPGRS